MITDLLFTPSPVVPSGASLVAAGGCKCASVCRSQVAMTPPTSPAAPLSTLTLDGPPPGSPRGRRPTPLRELLWLLALPAQHHATPGELAFAIGCALVALVVVRGLGPDPDGPGRG